MIPEIVDGEHLARANSLVGTCENLLMVMGPAFGGSLLILLDPREASR